MDSVFLFVLDTSRFQEGVEVGLRPLGGRKAVVIFKRCLMATQENVKSVTCSTLAPTLVSCGLYEIIVSTSQ